MKKYLTRYQSISAIVFLLSIAVFASTANAMLVIPPATGGQEPMVSFSTSSSTVTQGKTYMLNWNTKNVTACIASGDWSGNLSTSGGRKFINSALGTNTYILTCTGIRGTISKSITVHVISSQPSPSDETIGMNLAGISYYSHEDPFIDLFKTSAAWQADTNAVVPIDSDGWPTKMPVGASSVNSAFYLGTDLPQNQGRPLRITWDGTATITMNINNWQPIHTGDVITPSNGLTYALIHSSGLDQAHPFKNLHIVHTDQAAAFDAGEIFNPLFVDHGTHWSVLRFMDWNKTNGNTVSLWASSTPLTAASWAEGATGVPIEAEIALANKVHSDAWINIPIEADDNYIFQIVTYAHDHLDPSLKLHLEYSNEVWNTGFPQWRWAQDKAAEMWPAPLTDQNRAGALDWYGYRSVQMAKIARGVYGTDANTRLSVVISTQTAWLGLESYVWRGVARAQGTDSLFDEWAITTYWGSQLSTIDPSSHAKVLGWAASGAAGLSAAFAEIEHGGVLADTMSLDSMQPVYAYQSKVAKAHDLALVAYEGGFGATSFQFATQDEQDIVKDLFARLESDPRMGTLYTRMANDFFAAGGSTLTVFNDIGAASKWGTWGTLDTLYASSPRWDALVTKSGR